MHPLRLLGIQMADEAPETFGGGLRAYLGTIGFIAPLVGAEELVRHFASDPAAHHGLPVWLSLTLIAVGLPLFLVPAVWAKLRKTKPATEARLEYLSNEDSELSSAIRNMARRSAWGRWFASQSLANTLRVDEPHTMKIAAAQVHDALVNGYLEARGRKPGEIDYKPVPPTHWRSTSLHMIPDGITLWKMILIPHGGAEITPEGKVIGHNEEAVRRTEQIEAYDSLIVDARQFESLWPKNDKKCDIERKRLLKKAKRAGVDPAEIAKLEQG